ncbi:hypothetical protein QVH35_07530 [Candidatus Nitrosotenuis chungbukensis]|nr:hypothetical protein [Candidatus Nitrosotenuis chungbukensis]WKT57270.1 hypothetical protein QVH35_07530 [Candidatus Nitrosotenuis chungbukensis]
MTEGTYDVTVSYGAGSSSVLLSVGDEIAANPNADISEPVDNG